MSHDCVDHVTEMYEIPYCCTKIASAQVQNNDIVQSLLHRLILPDLWYVESAGGRFNFYSLRKYFTRNSTYQHKKGYFPCLIAIYTKMDKLHTIPSKIQLKDILLLQIHTEYPQFIHVYHLCQSNINTIHKFSVYGRIRGAFHT